MGVCSVVFHCDKAICYNTLIIMNGIEGDGDGLIRIQGADVEEGRRNRCTAECKLITVSGGWWKEEDLRHYPRDRGGERRQRIRGRSTRLSWRGGVKVSSCGWKLEKERERGGH